MNGVETKQRNQKRKTKLDLRASAFDVLATPRTELIRIRSANKARTHWQRLIRKQFQRVLTYKAATERAKEFGQVPRPVLTNFCWLLRALWRCRCCLSHRNFAACSTTLDCIASHCFETLRPTLRYIWIKIHYKEITIEVLFIACGAENWFSCHLLWISSFWEKLLLLSCCYDI